MGGSSARMAPARRSGAFAALSEPGGLQSLSASRLPNRRGSRISVCNLLALARHRVISVQERLADRAIPAHVARELAELRTENARLRRLLKLSRAEAAPPGPAQAGFFEAPPGPVRTESPPEAKVALFGALFAARTDIYAVRWENTRTGRTGW